MLKKQQFDLSTVTVQKHTVGNRIFYTVPAHGFEKLVLVTDLSGFDLWKHRDFGLT